jgi:hypothetical protein
MNQSSLKWVFLFLLASLALLPAIGHAQATRTWVSGVGDDANPCSRTAPCKTLAGAISKTAANGIINMLDPGGVGAVTITKSITIDGGADLGHILASGTNGVVINAGASDTVVLRNLAFQGVNLGLSGVNILQAGTVRIENCVIQDFSQNGIKASTTGALKLSVYNTTIQNIGALSSSNDGGISIVPGAGGSVRALFDRVSVLGASQWGVNVMGNLRLNLRDSNVSGGTGSGLRVDGSVGASQVVIDNSYFNDNSVNGIFSTGSSAIVRMQRSTITGNGQGLITASLGQIISFGNNVITGNAINGSPTSTASLQ